MPQCSLCTIYNSQDMEAAQMSTNGGVDVEGVVRIHSGILLSHKKAGDCQLQRQSWTQRQSYRMK